MTRTTVFVANGQIYSPLGRLNSWNWSWETADTPHDAEKVSATEAIKLIHHSGEARQIPVGIIGPRDATKAQLETAKKIGKGLAELGLTMICGGKSGVMEAAAKGCFEAGGLSVGLVPDHSWREANPYIRLPIATGLSEARNMIIAKSCEVLVAVGGSYGTLSEIAYGLHFSKPVITLAGAPFIEGSEAASDSKDALNKIAQHLINRIISS